MEAESDAIRRSGPVPERAAVILGNDALLAARPSTPAQLASACVLAGFDIILPPSAGDEIVAAAYLERLASSSAPAVVAAACPRVRDRLCASAVGRHLPCVAVASPPVAAARYLRATHGERLLITYVGDCPSAADPAIDARFTPAGFLASLHRQGIVVEAQPKAERHNIAWGRHHSTPAGIPSRRFIARPPIGRVVREMTVDEIEHDMRATRSPVVIDVTDAGCVCSAQRDELMEMEPLRSAVPLVPIPPNLDVTVSQSMPRSRATLRARGGLTGETPPLVQSPPRVVHPAPAAARPAEVIRQAGTVRRLPLLLLLPVAVLAGAAALGVAAYAAGSDAPGVGSVADSSASVSAPLHSDTAGGALRHTSPPIPDRSVPPATGPATGTDARLADSARADSNRSASKDATIGRRRPRRARPAEVIPGWLPQGQPWTPDSQAVPRRDSAGKAAPARRPPA